MAIVQVQIIAMICFLAAVVDLPERRANQADRCGAVPVAVNRADREVSLLRLWLRLDQLFKHADIGAYFKDVVVECADLSLQFVESQLG